MCYSKQFASLDESQKEEKKRERRRLQEQLRRIKRNEEKLNQAPGVSPRAGSGAPKVKKPKKENTKDIKVSDDDMIYLMWKLQWSTHDLVSFSGVYLKSRCSLLWSFFFIFFERQQGFDFITFRSMPGGTFPPYFILGLSTLMFMFSLHYVI